MASSRLQQMIRNLFTPNLTESISAEDMQLFVDAIFQSTESTIQKFNTPKEVDDFKLSDPEIPILKNDLVAIINDEEKNGIYVATIDRPFFKDLHLLSDNNDFLSTGKDNQILFSAKGRPVWGEIPTGYYILGTERIEHILNKYSIGKGSIFIAANTDYNASVPGVEGDGYAWDGEQWKNIGQLRGPEGAIGNLIYASLAEVNAGVEKEKVVSPYTLSNSNFGKKVEKNLGRPAKDGMILASQTDGTRFWTKSLKNYTLTDLEDVTVTPQEGQTLVYENGIWVNKNRTDSGLTRNRPKNPKPGDMYFDIELGAPIWFDEGRAIWVTAAGTQA